MAYTLRQLKDSLIHEFRLTDIEKELNRNELFDRLLTDLDSHWLDLSVKFAEMDYDTKKVENFCKSVVSHFVRHSKKKSDNIFLELLNGPTDTSRNIEKIVTDISGYCEDSESICGKISFHTTLPSLAVKGKIVSPAASVSGKFHYEEDECLIRDFIEYAKRCKGYQDFSTGFTAISTGTDKHNGLDTLCARNVFVNLATFVY
ncbi:hypothetical protein AHF37_06734 [Paragonimus kellicotti]|nr:hypothetical protein AHF37_06734 [Paragonimus kellicotti]